VSSLKKRKKHPHTERQTDRRGRIHGCIRKLVVPFSDGNDDFYHAHLEKKKRKKNTHTRNTHTYILRSMFAPSATALVVKHAKAVTLVLSPLPVVAHSVGPVVLALRFLVSCDDDELRVCSC
jgi:hypothetical protein